MKLSGVRVACSLCVCAFRGTQRCHNTEQRQRRRINSRTATTTYSICQLLTWQKGYKNNNNNKHMLVASNTFTTNPHTRNAILAQTPLRFATNTRISNNNSNGNTRAANVKEVDVSAATITTTPATAAATATRKTQLFVTAAAEVALKRKTPKPRCHTSNRQTKWSQHNNKKHIYSKAHTNTHIYIYIHTHVFSQTHIYSRQ